MTNQQITEALMSLVPDAKWVLVGDDYEDIEWIEGNKPTIKEIESEIKALPAKREALAKEQEAKRADILQRLGLTEEEAKLLLS